MKAKRMPSRHSWRLLGSFLLILGLFMAIQEQNKRIAELEAAEAESRFALAYQAEANGNRQYAVDIVFEEAAQGFYDESLMRELLFGEGLAMRLEGHREEVKAVAVSHDGLYIASGGGEPFGVETLDTRVLIWDIETGEELAACEGHTDSVTSVAFSPINNTILSGSRDGTMRLWDWNQAGCSTLMTFLPTDGIGHLELNADTNVLSATWIWDVAFSPDGASAISAGRDGTLVRWDIATGEALQQFAYMTGQTSRVNGSPSMATMPDGSLLAMDMPIMSSESQRPWVNTVAISPDGNFVVSGADSITYSNTDSNLLMAHSLHADGLFIDYWQTFVGHSHHVISVAFNPANPELFLSASRDGTIRYWRMGTGTVNYNSGMPSVFSVAGTETDIQSVAISPDGTMAAIGTGLRDGTGVREIYLWDLTEWHPIDVFEGLNGAVWDLAFSPDGSQLVAAMSDGTVLVWNLHDRAYNYQLSTVEMLEMLATRFGQ